MAIATRHICEKEFAMRDGKKIPMGRKADSLAGFRIKRHLRKLKMGGRPSYTLRRKGGLHRLLEGSSTIFKRRVG